ncbi:hypothetical protein BCR34DRAFT_605114 [Clohesyomyces aquaticus]|uniref:Heavy metal tolerance protein n=1 Tax=Clohesyomyces aquaticus TaxID=1231657 RepID=A0A1Y1Z0J7_9PLEO|nr:hypothetical protein BCR34DRAFT_605114 [Clohesyomyces aquaticus]
MADSPERPQMVAAMLLDYLHAPVVGFYFLGALTFGICILQKSTLLSWKRRRIALPLMSTILVTYIGEVLYYLGQSVSDPLYTAPKHAAIHCLGSILVWGCLTLQLFRAKSMIWHPWFGAFILTLLFETTICILTGVTLSIKHRYNNIPLSLSALRALFSIGLTIDGFLILIHQRVEAGTDEEHQSLLRAEASETPSQNGGPKYRTIDIDDDGDGDGDSEDGDGPEADAELKKQQAKRLEEQGGWFGYLKSFAVFLPYLWPKDDWRVMVSLAIRFIHLIQGRVLNLLTPRQIGIITNKLSSGSGVMPWKDIALWTFYSWFNSYAGFGVLDSFASYVVQNVAYERLTALAFSHIMRLSMDFHTNKDSGEVQKSVDQASSLNQLIELVLFDVCPVLIDLVVAMWYVTHLFDSYMAFIILFMGVVYIWLGIYFTTLSQPARRSYMEKQRGETKTVYESISNWQTVSYFNRVPYEQDRYGGAVKSTIRAQYRYLFRSVGGHAIQSSIMTFGFTGCCILAISQIISGQKPVGNLITFILYWDTMMSPLYMMAYSYRHISSCLIDSERLLQLLETKSTVTDKEGARDLEIKECEVEFKDVGFAYDPRKPVIRNVSFTAQPGQTVAFVGETGGGKSTMLKLLFRYYDVTGGSITIDGQDIRSVTQASLRDALGVVPQDPALFNQSIYDNIKYARLDATEKEIHDACHAAAMHDKIMSFPDGYKSKVGERGVRLSGGELQRVAIARVLLKNPRIVMLDEATSAIDSSIEERIQEAFKKLRAGRTTFVIAHRLSTIVEADIILVVDQGQIIERGTHAELLEKGGKYAELWGKQTAGNHSAVPSKAPSTAGEDDAKPELLIDITPPAAEEQGEGATASGRSEGEGVGRRKP